MIMITDKPLPEDAPRAIPQTIEVGMGRMGEIVLAYIPEGWAIAGSVMRYDAECWRVSFEFEGSLHGHRFKTEAEAREFFEKWTQ